MKKILLLLLVSLVFIGCSSDDKEEETHEPYWRSGVTIKNQIFPDESEVSDAEGYFEWQVQTKGGHYAITRVRIHDKGVFNLSVPMGYDYITTTTTESLRLNSYNPALFEDVRYSLLYIDESEDRYVFVPYK